MLMLSVDASAKAVSVAISEDDSLLGSFYLNVPQTHSETLMPMIVKLLEMTGRTISDMNCLAVTVGPGSFTGVRIAVSCIKGLAMPNNIPCIPISTLEAIAAGGLAAEANVICAVMDARRNQFYNANFIVQNGCLHRLTEDRAISAAELSAELNQIEAPVLLFGDGAAVAYAQMTDSEQVKRACDTNETLPHIRMAAQQAQHQRAAYITGLAYERYQQQQTIPADELIPVYLRPSQAERERAERQDK